MEGNTVLLFGSIFRKIFPQLRKESVIDDYGHGLPSTPERGSGETKQTLGSKNPQTATPPAEESVGWLTEASFMKYRKHQNDTLKFGVASFSTACPPFCDPLAASVAPLPTHCQIVPAERSRRHRLVTALPGTLLRCCSFLDDCPPQVNHRRHETVPCRRQRQLPNGCRPFDDIFNQP